MAVKQLNIFVENKTGALAEITEILKVNGIDMRTMVLADTSDYGVLRLIVSDTDKAVQALTEHGLIVKTIGITIAKIQNIQGGLSAILKLLDENDISIEYMYAFVAVSGQEAYAAMRFEDKDKALAVLTAHQVPLLSDEDI